MNHKLTVFLLTFSLLMALSLPLSALLPTAEEAALYDSIIRLHILANSDTEEDQSLKLKVRDGVLETASELLSGVSDKETAEKILKNGIATIESTAADILKAENSDYYVSVTLTKEAYPTRNYGSFSLPAGNYTSLRVLIGEAQGKNWWCMLFPGLCITSQTESGITAIIDESEYMEAGLTPSQVRIISGDEPNVKVKFRILEFIGGLLS